MADRKHGGPKLFKKGRVWHVDLRHVGGGRPSTGCTDRKAAAAVARRWERELADPAHTAAQTYSLGEALDALLADREQRGRAKATIEFYEAKAGHLVRVLGGDTPLATIDADVVDRYIGVRFREGASRHTVTKELAPLRGALRLAIRARRFPLPLEAVMPINWDAGYTPRTRTLTLDELDRLLWSCVPHRAAWLAYAIGTGGRASEVNRAQPGDVDLERRVVRVRGTKTEKAAREIPILPWTAKYLQVPLPLRPWADSPRVRYLRAACKRAGIDYVTANDVRRTAGTLLRERVGDSSLVAVYLGHEDGRMAERTYASLKRAESLWAAIKEKL